MRRRTLTLGVLLVLAAFFVLEQGAQMLAPAAQIAGLSTEYTKENAILPPTLYSVSASNYSYASEPLTAGVRYVGSLEVADARQVAFYLMDEGNFSLWRAGRPPSLILDNPSAVSFNFTLAPANSGVYYFVFDNPENNPVAVVFVLSSVQDIMVLNPLVGYAGYELLLLGIVFSFFGLRGGGHKAETKRAGRTSERGWKCKFCGARNPGDKPTFCSECGRSQN